MSRSIQEEIICVLWFICGFLSLGCIPLWTTKLIFIKAFLDLICVIYFALEKLNKEAKDGN